MTHRILVLVISLFIAWSAEAAMVRVASIDDARTITIERNGTRERLRLAGIEITDDAHARDLLQWTLDSRWVMVERTANGEYFVWRSPDALFINRELVLRGYARATLAAITPESTLSVTYLGTYDPPRSVTTARELRTGSGTRSRSSAQPSRPARSADSPAPGTRSIRRRPGRSSGS